MKAGGFWLLIFLTAVLSACGTAEQACVKYPTPEARADCEQRHRQVFSDFNKQQEQDKKAQRAAEKEVPEKPNGLCFKRQTSGELVCPN